MKKTLFIATLLLGFAAFADDHANCPMHQSHAQDVEKHGDHVMGFSHDATKHSFKITEEGGAIEVRALKADDATSIRAIRTHLQAIAKSFAAGDFAKPEAIHGRPPDGTDVMIARKSAINYQYSEIQNGARVRITTTDAAALDAVHRFLRFQIEEHHTGDSVSAER